MKKLNEVLGAMPTTYNAPIPLQLTQQRGLTSKDGLSTTRPLSGLKATAGTEDYLKTTVGTRQPELETAQRKSLQSVEQREKQKLWDEVPLRESPEAQDQLTGLLFQAYASQKSYGDKAEMMEYKDGMFQLILEDYCFREIKAAFIRHIKTSPDLPTPHDIIKVLDPSTQPLSATLYTSLRKKIQDEGYFPYTRESDFMRAFEAQEYAKVKR